MCLGCLKLSTATTCTVGDTYSNQIFINDLGSNNIRGKWYLNINLPATCSGIVTNYNIDYYDNNLGSGTYDIIFNIWKPTTSNIYQKVFILKQNEDLLYACVG